MSYDDKAKDIHIKKNPELGSVYICWCVILIDQLLKRTKTIIRKCF